MSLEATAPLASSRTICYEARRGKPSKEQESCHGDSHGGNASCPVIRAASYIRVLTVSHFDAKPLPREDLPLFAGPGAVRDQLRKRRFRVA